MMEIDLHHESQTTLILDDDGRCWEEATDLTIGVEPTLELQRLEQLASMRDGGRPVRVRRTEENIAAVQRARGWEL